jgi:hypothetical protein
LGTYDELRDAVAEVDRTTSALIHELGLARQAAITAINAEYDAKILTIRREARDANRSAARALAAS